MKLSDKLIELRKEKGWSQEDFAEKLEVSRQAISRWENGTALPDAQNILRISKLFNVTADYLLNDDYESEIKFSTIENATEERAIEETEPLIAKKKVPYWYLIVAICLVILMAFVIIKVVKNTNESANEVHHHAVFSSVKENEIAPTCKAEGSYDEVVYCSDCGEEILRTTKNVAKLAHTLSNSVKENEVAPACKTEGSYDEVVYCTRCREAVLRTRRSIAKLEHRFQDGKCIACEEAQPSEGLLYMSNGNGTCIVSLGNCTDENIVIPDYSPSKDKVVQIKNYGFAFNSRVKSVKIPETVTIIGEGAFQYCINLENVNLPSKITIIQSFTFDGCENLKEITIPSGVTTIGFEAFADCLAIESIVIPAKVTKIAKFAFRNFSGCDGTVVFEVYDGWELYDDSEIFYDIVDLKNGYFTPVKYLTFMYSDYTWRRN